MFVTAGALDARFRDLARPLERIAAATGVMALAVVVVVEALRELGCRRCLDPHRRSDAQARSYSSRSSSAWSPTLIGELKGFARHGRGSTADAGRHCLRQGGGLVPDRNGSGVEPTRLEATVLVVSFGLPVRNGAVDHRQGDRIGTRSDVRGLGARHLRQPVDGRDVGDLRRVSLLGTSAFATSRPGATSRSTKTSVRPSTTHEARTSAGAETTTGSSPCTPNAPSRRSTRRRTPCSARPSSSTTATVEPCRSPTRSPSSVE